MRPLLPINMNNNSVTVLRYGHNLHKITGSERLAVASIGNLLPESVALLKVRLSFDTITKHTKVSRVHDVTEFKLKTR